MKTQIATFDFAKPIRKVDPARPITAAEFKVAVDNLLELRKRDYSDIMKLFRMSGSLKSGLKDVMLIFEPLLIEHERTHGPKMLTSAGEKVRAESSVPPLRAGLFATGKEQS